MRAINVLVLLSCVACGDAFESAAIPLDSAPNVQDAGLDVYINRPLKDAGTGHETSLEAAVESGIDANQFDSSLPDTSVPDTSVPDTSVPDTSTCTPIVPHTWNCGGYAVTIPSQYCMVQRNGSSIGIESTPVECRCKETYNCSCIGQTLLSQDCSNVGEGFGTCGDSTGQVILHCQ